LSSNITKSLSEILKNGYQINPSAFDLLKNLDNKTNILDLTIKVIYSKKENNKIKDDMITKEDFENILPLELKKTEVLQSSIYKTPTESKFVIIKDPTNMINPIEGLEGFKGLFNSRFNKLLKIAFQRPDSYKIKRISSVKKETKGIHKIVGLVLDKKIKKNSIELIIDDETDKINIHVLEHKAKINALEISKDQLILLDINISKKGLFIANNIYSPDIPEHKPNYSKEVVYAAFTSDFHVGSKKFHFQAVNDFILWLNGKKGDDDIIKNLKYLVICGDIIDGIGIYPDQDKDLEKITISDQIETIAQLLEQIPKYIKIFIIPGNHDPVRQALPQPSINNKYAKKLYDIKNVIMLGNPAFLNLNGIKVLTYHGRSLDDVVATTPGLSYSKPTDAMKILLKTRHLAPLYGARTSISPEQEDHLVIDEIPDIFHCGHVHKIDINNYRNILMINSGTWQEQTEFQEKMGILPSPGLIPIVNLSTLDVIIKNFAS
jgi:DNA polymerase II small subunit